MRRSKFFPRAIQQITALEALRSVRSSLRSSDGRAESLTQRFGRDGTATLRHRKRVRSKSGAPLLICHAVQAPFLSFYRSGNPSMINYLRQFVVAALLLLFTSCVFAKDSKTVLNERLFEAAETGDLAQAKSALAQGANVNARDKAGNTPLILHIRMEYFGAGNIGLVQTLLARKAAVDARDNEGTTALMIAARLGFTQAVRTLLHRGANINVTDASGQTPLMHAAYGVMTEIGTVQSAPESVRILLSRGAKVNTKDKMGQTPLILAAKTDSWDAVHQEAALQSARLLINKGADKNAKTRNGNTALKWAQMRHHFEIVRLLRR